MPTAKIQDSIENVRTIKYTHSAAVVAGDIIVVNGNILIAVNDTAINTEGVYIYQGKVEMPKNNSTAFSVLDRMYYDSTANELTKTVTDIPCGYCMEGAASSATVATIFLDQKVSSIVQVAVTVNAASATGSSAADTSLKNGKIVGIYPTGNQDQFIDNVVLNADGSVTVTLAANATANNTFNVMVEKQ